MTKLCERRAPREVVDRPLHAPLRSRLGSRRLGSVLVLVMALLGILFVVGMTFLTTMNFEADLIALERDSRTDETGVDAVERVTDRILRDSLLTLPGMVGDTSSLGEWTGSEFEPDRLTWAELPNVHSLIAQIEPHWDPNWNGGIGRWVYDSFTNFEVLQDGPPSRTALFEKLDLTSWVLDGGVETGSNARVDSDGDGIADTRQTLLTAGDVSETQLAALAKLVNAPANPNGQVYLGLRVIPHGGMVNLSESHPNLIANVFDIDIPSGTLPDQLPFFLPQFAWRDWRPYAPQVEEASLRRRNILPPRVLSPTAIQGDPLVEDVDPDFGVPGGGDFAYWLFPPGESVRTGEEYHRHWPFSVSADGFDIWAARMDPQNADNGQYDRRHLVTTISHDDLLSRGGWIVAANVDPPGTSAVVANEDDVLDLMHQANQLEIEAQGDCTDPVTLDPIRLPFEYADYPHTIPNGYYGEGANVQEIDWCQCAAGLNGCRFNLRKGRLKLSLPWLNDNLWNPNPNATQQPEELIRLVQDAFTMILLNARSPYWGDYVQDDDDEWRWVWDAGRLDEIERTAAALTANLIDFADADDVPTRVEIRSADFTYLDAVGRGYDRPERCLVDADCPGGAPGVCSTNGACEETCIINDTCAGTDYVCTAISPGVNVCTPPPQFVYGLERQPFITEVAANADNGLYGVELINPYPDPDPIATANVYRLRVRQAGGVFTDFPLSANVMEGRYLVVSNLPSASWTTPFATGASVELVPALAFANGDTIYLLRSEDYPDPYDPGDTVTVRVVVDQFTVNGPNIATVPSNEFSMQRPEVVAGNVTDRWYAPIPAGAADEVGGHSLGGDNVAVVDPDRQPVEVLFANTGALADVFDNAGNLDVPGAFPTTGSLLLLMRHANRSIDAPGGNLAFTTELDRSDAVDEFICDGDQFQLDNEGNPIACENANGIGQGLVQPVAPAPERRYQIDNGRMPVFDVAGVHHFEPDWNPAENARNAWWQSARPGELYHLPWGLLVFDYFTALPLSNEVRPYTGDPDSPAHPRVDLDGLRVHGRINLNAAPWKVLAGLPLVPMDKIPDAFRPTIRLAAGLVQTDPPPADPLYPTNAEKLVLDNEAATIGDLLAKSIVAYREVRALGELDLNGAEHTTGDFGDTALGRGWNATDPAARRGTGFLSVGELANVRHDDAAIPAPCAPGDAGYEAACDPAFYRIDANKLATGGSYVEAIALLASLGDWVTVRSHVFTVYGTIRGDADDALAPGAAAADVDSRALRFQETLDRLPTFLGEPAPVRIGERVLTSYSDLRND